MKKPILFLSVVLGVSALFLFLYVSGIPAKTSDTLNQSEYPNIKNKITPIDLEQKLRSGVNVFVYFHSPDCSVCLQTTPFLLRLAEQKNIDLKVFDVLEFEEESDQYKIEYTPTLVYYEKGAEADRIEGGYHIAGGKPDPASERTFSDFFDKYTKK